MCDRDDTEYIILKHFIVTSIKVIVAKTYRSVSNGDDDGDDDFDKRKQVSNDCVTIKWLRFTSQ